MVKTDASAMEARPTMPERAISSELQGRKEIIFLEPERKHPNLSPALREWLDRVIVPALAREFLAEQDFLASAQPVAESAIAASAERDR